VVYHLNLTDGSVLELHNPADMPDVMKIESIEEPWIRATILTPDEYLGSVLKLCQDRRGVQIDLNYVGKRAMVVYDLPLNEVVFDFYDRLKSISKGYASFDYAITGYREATSSRCDPREREPVDALSMLVHRDRPRARPRDGGEAEGPDPPAPVQIPDPGRDRRPHHRPRDDPALRKDVTAKCYGGDITRKRKLLDKQKEGKKRMRQFGRWTSRRRRSSTR
jgi:GTP-binding protein LepA